MAGLFGETGSPALLIPGPFIFVGYRLLRGFTPGLFPVLWAFWVWTEAPRSGTRTNLARRFGPAVVTHFWTGLGVDLFGPGLGLGLLLPRLRRFREEVAKRYHVHGAPHGLRSRPCVDLQLGSRLQARGFLKPVLSPLNGF